VPTAPVDKQKAKLSDEEWIARLAKNPIYEHIGVRTEFEKARIWAEANNRQCTRRFFVNWLNRAKPMEVRNGQKLSDRERKAIDDRNAIESIRASVAERDRELSQPGINNRKRLLGGVVSDGNATGEVISAEVWTRLLFGIIPEHELQLAFKIAFANHSSPYPINAYDLKNAWDVFDGPRREHIAEEQRKRHEIEWKRYLETGVVEKVAKFDTDADGTEDHMTQPRPSKGTVIR
jgi:hypothetical protein